MGLGDAENKVSVIQAAGNTARGGLTAATLASYPCTRSNGQHILIRVVATPEGIGALRVWKIRRGLALKGLGEFIVLIAIVWNLQSTFTTLKDVNRIQCIESSDVEFTVHFCHFL